MDEDDWELQAAIAMSLGQEQPGDKRGAEETPDGEGGGHPDAEKESASKTARTGSAAQQGAATGASSSQQLPASAPVAQQPTPPQVPLTTPAPGQPAGGQASVTALADALLNAFQSASQPATAGTATGQTPAAPPAAQQGAASGGGALDLLQALLQHAPGGVPAGQPAGAGVERRARRSAARAPTQRAPAPPTPQWITEFVSWTLPLRPAAESVALPSDRAQATAALNSILGITFHIPDDSGPRNPPANAVSLPLNAQGQVSKAIGMHALRSALNRMRAAGSEGSQGPLELLCAAFARAHAASGTHPEFIAFWMDMITLVVLEKLKTDTTDDLFFAGGRDRLTFRKLLATGHLPQPLLARAVDLAPAALSDASKATEMWEDIAKGAFNDVRQFEFASAESAANLKELLAPLAAMTAHPPLLRIVAKLLLAEVVEVNAPTTGKGGSAGRGGELNAQAWERNSLMGPLLGISTYLDPVRARRACQGGSIEGPMPAALAEVNGYPRNRDAAQVQLQAAQHSVQQAHVAAHAILKRIATAKTFNSPAFPAAPDTSEPPPSTGKEVCLSWIAAAMQVCEPRTAGGEKAVLHPEYALLGPSDGFALGVAAVTLLFVTPVLNKLDSTPGDMLPKLMPASTMPAMSGRLGNLLHARRLGPLPDTATVSGDGLGDPDGPAPMEGIEEVGGGPASGASPSGAASSSATFMCAAESPGAAAAAAGSSHAAQAPSFAVECVYLAIRGMQVGVLPAMHRMNELMHMMGQLVNQSMQEAGPDAAHGRRLPPSDTPAGALIDKMYIVEDCQKAALLMEGAAVAATRMLGSVLTIIRSILECSDTKQAAAVPEPMIRDVVNFASFVITSGAPDLFAASKDLHSSMLSLAMILRSKLVTSAMTRSSIVDLLRGMLQGARSRSRGAPLTPPPMSPGAAALTEAVFQTVSGAGVVPALMVAYSEADAVEGLDVDKYHFDKFSMRHNVDVVLRELWKDDRCLMDLMAMAEADHPQREVLADFAKALLNDLSYLLEDSFDRIADVMSIHAIKEDPEKWGGLPAQEKRTKESFLQSQISTASGFMRMAMSTVSLILSLIQHAPIRAVFLEPARAAHSAHLCMHLIQQLLVTRDGGKDLTSCTQVPWQPNDVLAALAHVLTALAKDPSFAQVAVAQTSFNEKALSTAVTRLQGLEWQMQMAGAHADALQELLSACLALRAASVGAKGSAVADALAIPVPDPPADLQAAYVSAVEPHAYGTFDHSVTGAYMYDLAKRAKATAGSMGSRQRQKRLMKELRGMQAAGGLPVAAGASVFVRSDEERMDIVRACITGPEGTPYAYGMFFFDILFPQDYPNIPPLMLLETTGGGRVRFNPNLYADGKVCLSLLGTWHGSSHEKWDPTTSTLWQVLVSVQAMVFVNDPYFNEPNVEQMRNQTEGIAASKSLNSQLSINTVQWAMIDVLKNPKPGFEEAIKAHFRVLRPVLLANCQKWLKEMDESGEQGQLNRERMAGVLKELNELLNGL